MSSDVSKHTAGKFAEGSEACDDVTKEVEFSQQGGAVAVCLGKQGVALPVGGAHLFIAHVSNVHQEVKDIP